MNAEAADHDIQRRVQAGQSQIGKRHLDRVEKARHQESISEFHFVHFHPSEGSDLATAKRQIAQWR